jgi:hypothetical protein
MEKVNVNEIKRLALEMRGNASEYQLSYENNFVDLCHAVGIEVSVLSLYQVVLRRLYRDRGKGLKRIYSLRPTVWEAAVWHSLGCPEIF